jgi:hypothetical protein
MQFPDDENGDVLRRMAASGFPFDKPHEVDFFAVFPTMEAANTVARQYMADHHAGATMAGVETGPHHRAGAELKLVKTMLVTHENVTAFEGLLAERSRQVGGELDGWGVLQD